MPYTQSMSLNPTMTWKQIGQGICTVALHWNGILNREMLVFSCPVISRRSLLNMSTVRQNEPNIAPISQILSSIKYGKNSDKITLLAESPLPNASDDTFVQQVLGSFLYYARVIDLTTLHVLSAIALDQVNPTESTRRHIHQLLDYMHTTPNTVMHLYASDIILHVRSDASYMLAGCAACLVTAHQSNSTVIALSHVQFKNL